MELHEKRVTEGTVTELKFIASVTERDIDMLLLEELSASGEFQEWFATRVFEEPVFSATIGAWHSVYDAQLGESDLLFLFESLDGSRAAILIENKIDAPPQSRQGDRYRLRGEKGLNDGYWDLFKTCVIAPRKYLASSKHSESYDVELSYEEILAYFQSRRLRGARFAYKAQVMREGIEQNRRGYQPEYNEAMTKFVSDYYAAYSKRFPSLGMQKPGPRPAGSTWVVFRPASFPQGVRLVHQLTAGRVKLFFDGQADRFDSIDAKFASRLPDGASIDVVGKSVAISMEVPKVQPLTIPFAEQSSQIDSAVEKLLQLEKLVSENS
jgi:hypothetical protein